MHAGPLRLVKLLLATALLAACSPSPAAPSATAPAPLPAPDAELSALLPTGSFAATADIYLGPLSKPAWTLSGYVEFRPGDCLMDLDLAQAAGLFKDSYSPEAYAEFLDANPLVPLPSRAEAPQFTPILGFHASQRLVKPEGVFSFAKVSPPAPAGGVWVDSADPLFPLLDPSNALPSTLLTSNLPRFTPLPGTGPLLCAIPLLPYLTTSSPAPAPPAGASSSLSLRYAEEKFCAFDAAALAKGESMYRTALDLSSHESAFLAERFSSLRALCGFTTGASPHELVFSELSSGEYRLTMSTDTGILLYDLLLKPSEPRPIYAPDAPSNYLEHLAERHAAGASLEDLIADADPSFPRG